MSAKKTLFISLLFLMLISACAQPSAGGTDLPETNPAQLSAADATALPTGEALATETVEAEVDLSGWSQSSLATFSSDNSLLAVYGTGITVYDSASLQQIAYLIPDEQVEVVDLAFSLDNRSILAAYVYYDGVQNIYGIQTYDFSSNTTVNDVEVLPRGDNYQPLDIVTLSPDGKTLALFDAVEGILTLWDVASGEQLYNLNKYAFCLAFSPTSNILAICDYSSFKYEMNLLDLTNGNEVHSIDMLELYNGPARVGESVGGSTVTNMRVAFSADGNILAVAALYDYVNAGTYSLTLIDLSNGNELVNFDVPVSPSMSGNPLFALAFSNDGKLLASGSATEIKIWDTASAQELQSIEYPVENNAYAQYFLIFTPDDSKIISASEWNYQVIMWDVATGAQLTP